MSAWRDIFGQVMSQVSDHVQIEDPEMRLALRLHAKTQQHLQGSWGYAQKLGISCQQRVRGQDGQVLRCVEVMSSACVACRGPVCLGHGAVVFDSGDIICFACIGHAQSTVKQQDAQETRSGDSSGTGHGRQGTTPFEDEAKLRRKFLKRLRLTGEPTEEEIRMAFKREAATAHPDRVPADKKQKAHEKFVMLGEARDWLLARLRKKAA